MREIKFRCWDKENKEMLDVEYLHWDDCTREFSIRTTMYTDYFDIEDMILMQYVGLKDENGKEVYEGDILEKIYTDYNDKEFLREKYLVQNNICGWELRNLKKPKSHRSFQLLKGCKIIGNIYENPELLEDK